ncbi:MAG: hypothetical protein ABI852_02980 [Gemmatimonadaceae bacterium]
MMRRARSEALSRGLVALVVLLTVPSELFAQGQVRKPYSDAIVVEETAVIVSLKQQQARWRPSLDGKPGFYSWRLDMNAQPTLGIVLAADTMMRVDNLAQIVKGSSLRLCAEGKEVATSSCKTILRDTVGVHDDFVQIILRDTSIVSYFREVRPGSVRSTTFDPHGRFHLERLRVLYRDFPKRNRTRALTDTLFVR